MHNVHSPKWLRMAAGESENASRPAAPTWTFPAQARIRTKKPQPVLRLGLEKESAVASPTCSKLPLASLVVMFHFVALSATL